MPTDEPLPTIQKYRTGQIDLSSATLRVALFDDSTAYSIDVVNHEFVSDVLDGGTTAQELGDASYSREAVVNASVTVDGADSEVVVDADDVTFVGLDGGETIQGYIIYEQVGGDDTTPGDDPIIAIEDEVRNANGNPVTTNGSDVTIEFSAEGIITVSNA
jgi:hypothetical protein